MRSTDSSIYYIPACYLVTHHLLLLNQQQLTNNYQLNCGTDDHREDFQSFFPVRLLSVLEGNAGLMCDNKQIEGVVVTMLNV